MLPNADKGIEFLFKPDFSKINGNVFLAALGQSFYSLSIAMGCLCTYASYFSRHTNLTNSAMQIGIIDCLVAILAGLMIFPAAFSVGVNPDSGPSLIFITLPNVFTQAFAGMPLLGYLISLLFFVLLTLAALTSLISLHEVSTAFFHEEFVMTRKKAALLVTVTTSVIGAFCSLSLGAVQGLEFFGKPAYTPIGCARLAMATGAAIVPMYTLRNNANDTYTFKILPEIPFEQKATEAETLRYNTQIHNNIIESIIREHPDQWVWMHERWKTTPEMLQKHLENRRRAKQQQIVIN